MTSTEATGVMPPRSSAFAKWMIFGICVAVQLLAFAQLPDLADVELHISYMLRVTARVAFFCLMLAYLAKPLVKLLPGATWPRWLLANRRYLGLSMALAHTVHFGYVVALFVFTETQLELVVAVFGGLAFVLMWLMAATSNNWSMRRLGRNWSRLHTTGLHYLWLIFMQSFVGVVLQGPQMADGQMQTGVYFLYLLLVTVGFAGLGLRVVQWFAQRSRRAR